MENANCIKGKGLEGKFVYGWDGTDLVLVPSSSPDYEQLAKLNDTRFANKRICAKDLKVGATYLTKSGGQIVYLGKFDYYESMYHFDGKFFETFGQMEKYAEKNEKRLYEEKSPYDRWSRRGKQNYDFDVGTCSQRYFFSTLSDMSISPIKSVPTVLIDVVSENCVSDFAQRFEKLENNTMYSPYDESKDVKVYYDLETLEQRINGTRWGVGVNAEWNGKDVRFEIRNSDDGKVICSKTNYDSNFDPCDLFKCDQRYVCKRMLPVDLKEVFDKFKFFYTEQYLANGNYYRRAW